MFTPKFALRMTMMKTYSKIDSIRFLLLFYLLLLKYSLLTKQRFFLLQKLSAFCFYILVAVVVNIEKEIVLSVYFIIQTLKIRPCYIFKIIKNKRKTLIHSYIFKEMKFLYVYSEIMCNILLFY